VQPTLEFDGQLGVARVAEHYGIFYCRQNGGLFSHQGILEGVDQHVDQNDIGCLARFKILAMGKGCW
jgi:hypothetical protein